MAKVRASKRLSASKRGGKSAVAEPYPAAHSQSFAAARSARRTSRDNPRAAKPKFCEHYKILPRNSSEIQSRISLEIPNFKNRRGIPNLETLFGILSAKFTRQNLR